MSAKKTVCPECKYVLDHSIKCSRNVQRTEDQQQSYAVIKGVHDLVRDMKEELGADALVMKNGKPVLSRKARQWIAQRQKGMK